MLTAMPLAPFISAVIVVVAGVRVWLSIRQSRWLSSHATSVPAPFDASISLADHRRAIAYHLDKQQLARAHALLDTIITLAFTVGGGIALFDSAVAGTLAAPGIVRDLLLLATLAAILTLTGIPLDLYGTFVVESRHGFNKTTPRLWIVDQIKGISLAALLGGPLCAAVLGVMYWAGNSWWLAFWAAWLGINVLMLWMVPAWIAPLFNKFEPLADQTLADRVQALLARCGFRAGGLYVMDGSRRSAHGNAYFTGTGASRRIVFYDTLLATLDADEIEAVLAHELGHFSHRHIRKRLALLAVASFLTLWGAAAMLDVPALSTAMGIPDRSAGIDLALLAFLLPPVLFFVTPLGAMLSRRHEYEADAYAARHVSATALERALVKLYRDNAAALSPDPLHSRFFDGHPPALARIGHLRGIAGVTAA